MGLAADIDGALATAGLSIDAVYDSVDKIVLRVQDATARSFSIRTVSNSIDDLAADIQRALDHVGIGDDVTVTVDGTNLVFTEGDEGRSR